MALPKVSIEYRNGGLGLVAPSDDRVVGLIMNGIGFQNTPIHTPKQLFSVQDFDDWMTASNAVLTHYYPGAARKAVQDFYSVAGTGAELWFMFTAGTVTTPILFSDGHCAGLMNAADGRINVLGVIRNVETEPTTPTLLDGLDADILNALDEAHAFAVDYANRHAPVRVILDGRAFSGDTAVLRNLKTHTFNRVAVCMAAINSTSKSATAMGLLLGRIASLPVNVNPGRVSDGEAPTSEAYITNGQTVKAFADKAIALHDKGYIFLRKHVGRAGYFWNDAHMATTDTDDYFSLENGRVIDKAARIAYATYLNHLMATVLVDPATGKVLKTTMKQYQAEIERAISLSMAANGEVSGVDAFVDPAQDVLATGKLVVDLRITPTGTNRTILVRLGLYNPNAA